jgi:hypothetical protein
MTSDKHFNSDPTLGTTRLQPEETPHEQWSYERLCAAVDKDNKKLCARLGAEIERNGKHTPKNIQSLDPSKTKFLKRHAKRLAKEL